MRLVNDILNDYKNYCEKKLLSEFVDYSPTDDTSISQYHCFKYRMISELPRDVIELEDIVIPFEYQTSYQRILLDIKNGNSLKKYQSRKLKKLNYNDDMLSHWNIQHFHLGGTIESDGFVNRTSELLFIHFSHTQAHIIGVFSHGDWCDLDVIEIIHENWPTLLYQFESQNSKPKKPLTEKEHKALRKNNCNATIVMKDGTEYLPPGIGVMSNGDSILVRTKIHQIILNFEKAFNDISLNINMILDQDPQKRKSDTLTIGLEMNEVSQRCVYVIKETGHRFTLNY